MTTIREIMSSESTSVTLSTPTVEVAQLMKASGAGAIPVCENGKFHGIITERAIVIGVVAASCDPGVTPAGSVMSRNCPTISPNEDIWRSVNLMADGSIKVLPVLQDGKLVGLLKLDALTRYSPALVAMAFSKSIQSQTNNSAFQKQRAAANER